MSFNCHHLVLFKSPRDSSQVNHLTKQMFPGHVKYMQEAFQGATKQPSATSGCTATSSLGRRNAPMLEGYKKSEPLQSTSVEHGPATEKEPRLFEATGKVYTRSMQSNFESRRRRFSENHLLNVLKGTVPVSKPAKKTLLIHKKSLITLAEKSTPLEKKKNLLVQHGNFFKFIVTTRTACSNFNPYLRDESYSAYGSRS